MSEHHPTLAPSSWPAIYHCGAYRSSSGSSDAADRGADLHDRAMRFAAGEITLTDGDPDDHAVEWAVRACARVMDVSLADLRRLVAEGVLLREARVSIFRDFRKISFGSPDLHGMVSGRLYVFDYKFGHASLPCLQQLAAYALGCMDIYDVDSCVVVPIYAAMRKSEPIVLSRAQAEAIADRVLINRESGCKKRNSHCHYCADYATCSEWADGVSAMPVPLSGLSMQDALSVLDADPKTLTESDAVLLSALDLWLRYAMQWAKKVHERAKSHIRDAVIPIPGVEVRMEQPRATVADVDAVYHRSALPPDRFMRVCKVSLSDLAKEMSLADVQEAFAKSGKEIPFDCLGAKGGLLKSKIGAALRVLMADALSVGEPVEKVVRNDAQGQTETQGE